MSDKKNDWQRSESIASESLWRTHERRRERLVIFARGRLQAQLISRGASHSEIEAERFYLNADEQYRKLSADSGARATALATAIGRIRKAWPEVEVQIMDSGLPQEIPSGDSVCFQALVKTGSLSREDICVELYT